MSGTGVYIYWSCCMKELEFVRVYQLISMYFPRDAVHDDNVYSATQNKSQAMGMLLRRQRQDCECQVPGT